jgi:hypothetical protein
MADWPNVGVTGRVEPLISHIRKVNVPPKVTTQWLEAAGFRSKNDRALLGLLKGLGYIDPNGAPTDKWAELRGSDEGRKASIGRQMRVAYPQVFENYPVESIPTLTKDELKTFIRPKVTFGEESLGNVVDTFFVLKGLATFGGGAPATSTAATVTVAIPQAPTPAAAGPASTAGAVNIAINLSLELPVTTDADVYDKLFEAMAKHLGTLVGRGS